MKIITDMQCRAARALLNISREELSKISAVSATAIGSFETGAVEARVKSNNQISSALEAAGVEFIDNDGVRLRRDNIRSYQGKAIHRQLLDEIYADLKPAGGEILIKGMTERKWTNGDDEKFLDNHLKRLKEAGITERILLSDKDNVFIAPLHWYRQIPDRYFSPHTQWIFNGKVAMVTWGDIESLTIIENQMLFQSETKSFNCIWENVATTVQSEDA
jgi:transcriptional regulator with XRE-family HTH domain